MNHWGKVMNDELAAISGKYEELVGRLQEKFGIAEQQVEEFKKSIDHLKKSNVDLTRLQKSSLSKKKEVERNIGESKSIIEETTNIMRRCTILITKKVYSSVNYLQRDPLTLQQQIQQLL